MQAPEHEGASVVMLGSFNPAIFQPRWLGTQGLIRPEEAENAKITVIQSEVTDFSTEWFQMQVLQQRFQLQSTDPRHYAPLRDLATSVFLILSHTPITALGINRTFHFRMSSQEAWHNIGHLLAPKDRWNQIMDDPGLRSMLMQGKRKNADGGVLRVKVEPSARVEHGLFVEVNEEFRGSSQEATAAQWVPDCLSAHWDSIMRFSENASQQLLSLVRQ